MENLFSVLRNEGQAELRALNAIQRLYKWMEKNHPAAEAVSRTVIIKQCIREVQVEQRFRRIG
jgi:hypothetical protein